MRSSQMTERLLDKQLDMPGLAARLQLAGTSCNKTARRHSVHVATLPQQPPGLAFASPQPGDPATTRPEQLFGASMDPALGVVARGGVNAPSVAFATRARNRLAFR